eukprot:6201071-Pleurochrysis_carterae.AAC.1
MPLDVPPPAVLHALRLFQRPSRLCGRREQAATQLIRATAVEKRSAAGGCQARENRVAGWTTLPDLRQNVKCCDLQLRHPVQYPLCSFHSSAFKC